MKKTKKERKKVSLPARRQGGSEGVHSNFECKYTRLNFASHLVRAGHTKAWRAKKGRDEERSESKSKSKSKRKRGKRHARIGVYLARGKHAPYYPALFATLRLCDSATWRAFNHGAAEELLLFR